MMQYRFLTNSSLKEKRQQDKWSGAGVDCGYWKNFCDVVRKSVISVIQLFSFLNHASVSCSCCSSSGDLRSMANFRFKGELNVMLLFVSSASLTRREYSWNDAASVYVSLLAKARLSQTKA